MEWISSRITVTPAQARRPLSEVRENIEGLGVVIQMWEVRKPWPGAECAAYRRSDRNPDFRNIQPFSCQMQHFPQREREISVDIVDSFQGRNVDNLSRSGQVVLYGGSHQTVDANRKAARVLPDPVGAQMRV
jgi:hypothetical protein